MTIFSRNPSDPCFANKETDTGRLSYVPSGMLTCEFNQFPISSYVYTGTLKRERERERTWQKPDTPATDNRLKALTPNVSNVLGSVCNFGGSPGTVGIARIPKSYTIDPKSTMRERLRNNYGFGRSILLLQDVCDLSQEDNS